MQEPIDVFSAPPFTSGGIPPQTQAAAVGQPLPPPNRQMVMPLQPPASNFIPPIGMGEESTPRSCVTPFTMLLSALVAATTAAAIAYKFEPGWRAPTSAALASVGTGQLIIGLTERDMFRLVVSVLPIGAAWYLLKNLPSGDDSGYAQLSDDTEEHSEQ